MAIELKFALPFVLLVCAYMIEIYCAEGPSSFTPWPELGPRRHAPNPNGFPVGQHTTLSPKRDFVSQPSAWNKPLLPQSNQHNPPPSSNAPIQQQSVPNRVTTLNPNIRLSYAAIIPTSQKGNSATNKNNAPLEGPTRDYVNSNIKLSYDSSVVQQNNDQTMQPKPNSPAAGNQNLVQPAIPSASIPSPTNNKPTSPPRDYVNPIAPISYSNAVIRQNNNNALPAGSSMNPQSSTTPASRVSGSNNNNNNNENGNGPPTSVPKDREYENNELKDFSESLIRKDTNNAFKHIKVNYQGTTRSSSMKDEAPEPLMTIDEAAYKIPSIEKLALLHNNYILQSDKNEVYTAAEKMEENNFLDTILSTPVMQHTRNFLVSKGKISKDPKDFKDILRTLWFNMYSRGGGRIGSSGFEHIFLGEIKNGGVSGLHNWLYFNEEEKKKTANYLGYMKKLEFEKGAILKFHFNFQNIDKPVGSMFIGTSPEFELALYSTCFLIRPDDVCPLRLGGKNFVIRTYTYRYRGKTLIGSAFPEI